MRRFELHRSEDVTGVSGIGTVAEGVEFTDGVVAIRWRGEWPTSTVVHDKGIEAVDHIHGHNGKTKIHWVDEREFIACPKCNKYSYNTADIKEEFCGNCKLFHEDMILPFL